MALKPKLFFGTVMHHRLLPKENKFVYKIYYLFLPLAQIRNIVSNWRFGFDHPALLSFHTKDHGRRNTGSLEDWAFGLLQDYGITADEHDIVLVTLPRVLGYVFNPVSFWLILNRNNDLRAVLYEVNNTFGESHTYVCLHPDGRTIIADEWLEADKIFHVSPFLERHGHYRFRFALHADKLGIWIDYWNDMNDKQLLTSVTGTLTDWTNANLNRAFWAYPLMTVKTVLLIHWQAIKLLWKKINYVRKPLPQKHTVSFSRSITKM